MDCLKRLTVFWLKMSTITHQKSKLIKPSSEGFSDATGMDTVQLRRDRIYRDK